MSKSDGAGKSNSKGDSKGDTGWLFVMIVFAVGVLLFVVCQQRVPALATMGALVAIIGALGIFTRLRDIGS